MDLAFYSATKLARMIRAKKIGCVELLDHYVARMRRYNPALNAIIATRLPAARRTAIKADAALRRRSATLGRLHGVPMTIKESFDVVGMPTTWGLPELRKHRAKRNAVVVQRLLDAGANLFGKTNVPVHLADWQTFNPVYGTTSNPWDLARTPGGSSGGSAAALAAGLSALDYGSDIGASIRNPAHYCGVFGHKPTYRIVTPQGQTTYGKVSESDISVVGPLARSPDDLALGLAVTAGPDAIDGSGWKLALPAARQTRLRDFRVAVMLSHRTADVDESVQQLIRKVARFTGKRGAKVSFRARPDIDPERAHRIYVQLLRYATSGRQPQSQYKRFVARRPRLHANDYSYEAQFVRGTTLAPREWSALNEQRHRMRMAWAKFFEDWDVLLCPAAATAAFPHMHAGERWERMIRVNGRPQPSTTQMFWAGFSGMVYLPSTVAPIGLTREGLPVGVQIVGPQYADYTTIRFAQLLEREYYRFQPPPGY
ncbi:MAG: amidase [Betaproteobacteria bacterium]|jgi:amidase|nr:amidase [Betaproteobacteria bacterium]